MTLPFSLYQGTEPTCFPQLILSGLHAKGLLTPDEFTIHMDALYGRLPESYPIAYELDRLKLHTIRDNEKHLWRPGVKIHMVIYNRSEKRYQFVPVLECTDVQRVFMTCYNELRVSAGKYTLGYHELEQFAKNDGFATVDALREWFFPGESTGTYSGSIIHWTDLRY